MSTTRFVYQDKGGGMRWPKSIRWRYSLRALLVVITLFMVWGGYHANRGWKQRAAEAVLRKHGATFVYGKRSQHNRALGGYVMAIYEIFVHVLWGDAHIQTVTVQSPLEPEVVDALLALPQMDGLGIQPRKISGLEFNRMHSTGNWGATVGVPDGALEQIFRRHRLTEFGMAAFILDTADCRAIARHRSLQSVGIVGCRVPEKGLAEIATLPRLRSLNLMFCPVTGDELSIVPGSPSLETIEASRTNVGVAFAEYVAQCPRVRTLRLNGKSIDDDFISALGAHPSLSELQLFGGAITDDSLTTLERMPSLEVVHLPRGLVGEEALESLRAARPNMYISQ